MFTLESARRDESRRYCVREADERTDVIHSSEPTLYRQQLGKLEQVLRGVSR